MNISVKPILRLLPAQDCFPCRSRLFAEPAAMEAAGDVSVTTTDW